MCGYPHITDQGRQCSVTCTALPFRALIVAAPSRRNHVRSRYFVCRLMPNAGQFTIRQGDPAGLAHQGPPTAQQQNEKPILAAVARKPRQGFAGFEQ